MSQGIDQIPVELIQEGGNILYSEVYKLTNSFWNKEKLPQQWKEFITVTIYRKSDKSDCNNCIGISLLLHTKLYLMFSFSRLTPYAEEVTENHGYEFRRNR
jgi:hypothetical protein